MRRRRKCCLEGLKHIDFEILKAVLIERHARLGDIKPHLVAYFVKNDIKEVRYSYLYKRIEELRKKKLIVTTFERPLVLKINPEFYSSINRYVITHFELEKKIENKLKSELDKRC